MKTKENKYTFSSFQELVDRVPGDRIRDCMEEIGKILATSKSYLEAYVAFLEREGKLTQKPDQLFKVPNEFTWIDDGKGDLQARMINPFNNEPILAIKITKDKNEN